MQGVAIDTHEGVLREVLGEVGATCEEAGESYGRAPLVLVEVLETLLEVVVRLAHVPSFRRRGFDRADHTDNDLTATLLVPKDVK